MSDAKTIDVEEVSPVYLVRHPKSLIPTYLLSPIQHEMQ
jgi:hypothetical protein